MIHNPCINR